MSIAAIGAYRAAGATKETDTDTGASTTQTKAPGTLDREAFLKLLVAQLRYQDPSKPMDSSEMVSQSAQLSMVDELSNISTLLTNSAITDKLTLAGSMVGKQISFTDPDGKTVTATVQSVTFSDTGTLVLTAGDWQVPMELVTAVGPPPAPAESSATGSDASSGGSSSPAATDPASTPAASDPAVSDPAASDPAASDPAATDPAASASDPAASDPAASDPAATDPAATDPAPAGDNG